VRFRLEQQEEELKEGVISANEWKTEKEIEQEIYADQDFWHFRWEDFTACLASILHRKNPDGYWKAQVRNFGWRNLDGVKFLQASDGESFLHKILPQTRLPLSHLQLWQRARDPELPSRLAHRQ
jgi:hypothetical protein